MNKRIARRTASNVRAALAIVAFTVLAALGFATTKSVRPITRAPAEVVRVQAVSSKTTPAPVHAAPAACPMPAGVFRTR
jgi:hypothetical protein